jgi:hypothetical protein
MEYGFTHDGKVYAPSGQIDGADATPAAVAEHNQKTEAAEIAWLKTGPDRLFLYVQGVDAHTHVHGRAWTGYAAITTWPGTVLDDCAEFGPLRRFSRFGRGAERRSVRCTIFGRRYVGWYFESSGDYCRLRKAKGGKP